MKSSYLVFISRLEEFYEKVNENYLGIANLVSVKSNDRIPVVKVKSSQKVSFY